ncbi:MAG: class I SAM-dependent DNA methyltransferase [Candidatus Hodarchaeota archaeon]
MHQGGLLVPERPSEKYYRDTARFYDLFVQRPDETLYLELAKRFGSPILELACGTGRITLLLAQAGYEITGIELSPEMLEIAQEKLRQLPEDVQSRVSFNRGDITNFQLDKKFAMVIIPWSFKFLLTTDDQLACLRQVRQHLADNGVFILDLYPREAIEMGEKESHTVEIDGATITKTYIYSTDLMTQLRHTTVLVDVVYPDGKTEQLETKSVVSIIMPREVELLVRTAGLEIVEEYGGNDLSEYKLEDWKRVLVLKKESEG